MFPIASPFVPVLVGVLVPELRPARENARLEIGSQRGRNSHRIGVLGIYDLRGLSYGRTELLVDSRMCRRREPGLGLGLGLGLQAFRRRERACLPRRLAVMDGGRGGRCFGGRCGKGPVYWKRAKPRSWAKLSSQVAHLSHSLRERRRRQFCSHN